MPAILPIAAAEPGFSFADHWALGLLFLALALFMAIGALSHQRERAFSPSLVYLALGAIAACGLWRRSPLGAAIVLGSALAPTDPVLAGDVGVGPPGEDEGRSETEFALTAEAAANDGLGTPFLLLGLLLAELGRRGEAGAVLAEWLVADVLYAIVVAVVVGAAAGYGIAALSCASVTPTCCCTTSTAGPASRAHSRSSRLPRLPAPTASWRASSAASPSAASSTGTSTTAACTTGWSRSRSSSSSP